MVEILENFSHFFAAAQAFADAALAQFAAAFASAGGWLSALNAAVFSYLMTPLLLGVGLFFSLRTRFVQLRALLWLARGKLCAALRPATPPAPATPQAATPQTAATPLAPATPPAAATASRRLSNFESLVISTGARVGIGNIVGVALAVHTGGSGALVWMALAAFLGAATAFCECTLAQLFARTSGGGVAHYIRYGLRQPRLAAAFVVCLVSADAFGFNPLLAHTLNAELVGTFGLSPLLGAALIAALAALIFARGIALGKFIVPAMLCGYLGCAIWVLCAHAGLVLPLAREAFSAAFSLQAGFGALLGGAVMVGIKQGLFSNEAGLGSAPNAASAARANHACVQGLVQMSAVALDLAICLASAVLVLIFAAQNPAAALAAEGAQALISAAFSAHFGAAGGWLFYAFVLAFCLTSFYGNFYYSVRAMSLFGRPPRWFFAAAVSACALGALYDARTAWELASSLMCAQALVNLYAILRLQKPAAQALDDFERRYVR